MRARERPHFSPVVESMPVTEDRTPRWAKTRPKPCAATTTAVPRPGRLPARLDFDQLPPKVQATIVRALNATYEGCVKSGSGGNNDQRPPQPGKTAIR
jgi:hypothetical protein